MIKFTLFGNPVASAALGLGIGLIWNIREKNKEDRAARSLHMEKIEYFVNRSDDDYKRCVSTMTRYNNQMRESVSDVSSVEMHKCVIFTSVYWSVVMSSALGLESPIDDNKLLKDELKKRAEEFANIIK